MTRIYIQHRFVLRLVGTSPRRRRWFWQVRYRATGQPLSQPDLTVDGRAWTGLGAHFARWRWLRRHNVVDA